jgi:hypothetical protein
VVRGRSKHFLNPYSSRGRRRARRAAPPSPTVRRAVSVAGVAAAVTVAVTPAGQVVGTMASQSYTLDALGQRVGSGLDGRTWAPPASTPRPDDEVVAAPTPQAEPTAAVPTGFGAPASATEVTGSASGERRVGDHSGDVAQGQVGSGAQVANDDSPATGAESQPPGSVDSVIAASARGTVYNAFGRPALVTGAGVLLAPPGESPAPAELSPRDGSLPVGDPGDGAAVLAAGAGREAPTRMARQDDAMVLRGWLGAPPAAVQEPDDRPISGPPVVTGPSVVVAAMQPVSPPQSASIGAASVAAPAAAVPASPPAVPATSVPAASAVSVAAAAPANVVSVPTVETRAPRVSKVPSAVDGSAPAVAAVRTDARKVVRATWRPSPEAVERDADVPAATVPIPAPFAPVALSRIADEAGGEETASPAAPVAAPSGGGLRSVAHRVQSVRESVREPVRESSTQALVMTATGTGDALTSSAVPSDSSAPATALVGGAAKYAPPAQAVRVKAEPMVVEPVAAAPVGSPPSDPVAEASAGHPQPELPAETPVGSQPQPRPEPVAATPVEHQQTGQVGEAPVDDPQAEPEAPAVHPQPEPVAHAPVEPPRPEPVAETSAEPAVVEPVHEASPDPVAEAPVEAPAVDVAPVDVAPVDVAPVDVAPVDVASVDTSPVDVAPVDVEPVVVAPADEDAVHPAPAESTDGVGAAQAPVEPPPPAEVAPVFSTVGSDPAAEASPAAVDCDEDVAEQPVLV